ncbi:MAG TPA: COX15/CtaA family protein [Thermoanaerobaculaceae bacterium]|nr:COX15/CtaA family protein [Thermoanaerobaculaceae bacterium]HRS15270.1 COX15/CtaA family protein [Thermoanaerobaculaceae bacterium]
MHASEQRRGGDNSGVILTVGFGTTVAMWVAGYLLRLPGVEVAPAVVGPVLVALLIGGGGVAAWFGRRGWRSGLWAGALASLLNLLVLGSLLAAPEPNRLRPSALLWLPGSLLLGAGLGALGGALGARWRRTLRAGPSWNGAFAAVAAAATLALLAVGGLVTSHGAGLAVVDWPNSFGYNMFLYPLSRMTGGVYFEHAHRLFGSLVGLTTVVLAVRLWVVERRRSVRWLSLAAAVMVSVQGVLGGLRVTGTLTLSTDAAAMAPSTGLAAVHGVLGQLFFATLVGLAVLTSRTWTTGGCAGTVPVPAADRLLTVGLAGAVVVQLVLGALQRHLATGLLVHITMAAALAALAAAAGGRLASLGPPAAPLPAWGTALLVVAVAQILLGLAALAAVGGLDAEAPRAGWRAIVTTLHQTTGAILLGTAVVTALLAHRQPRTPGSSGP